MRRQSRIDRPAIEPSAEEAVRKILDSIPRVGAFAGVEVLKSVVRSEHGSLMVKITVDRDGGVDTNLCEAISKYLIRCFDALPPPVPPYEVEVASAGVERPLLVPEHFRKFAGRMARVITSLRIANRTEFVGRIESADDAKFVIADPHAGTTAIPYEAIKRANLVFDPRDDLKKR